MGYLIPSTMPLYAVSVRQYRPLQSRLLQCLNHSKPPCDLLRFPNLSGYEGTFTLWNLKELYLPFKAHRKDL